MNNTEVNTSDLKVFTNHIYELEKGVRRMVLYTTHGRNRDFVVRRLDNRNISYVEQPVGNGRINIFFGSDECIDAVRLLLSRPLYELTPEEDFILGAMLGYDICAQYKRYCRRKGAQCDAKLRSWPLTGRG